MGVASYNGGVLYIQIPAFSLQQISILYLSTRGGKDEKSS